MSRVSIGFAMSTALAFAAGSGREAPAGAYKTDPSHSSVNWSFNHFGLSHYTARFTKVDARLDWNPTKPAASTLSVAIDPLSVRTDYPWPEQVDLDAKIGGDEAFLAGKPIAFVSKKIRVTGRWRPPITSSSNARPILRHTADGYVALTNDRLRRVTAGGISERPSPARTFATVFTSTFPGPAASGRKSRRAPAPKPSDPTSQKLVSVRNRTPRPSPRTRRDHRLNE